ncbi:Hsp20/alpha crystallin family protein [Nitriliruptor alkaliphilus]|uniref:Hsp20/alpha crystallin family protein n=1 Tax=Nitriliruptor alkaliphilus TaxID=427918 RepID=UPI0012ED5B63|nr:Hsp20/alpha crystallin family protein [Nitriliruptor alkaliphilus]
MSTMTNYHPYRDVAPLSEVDRLFRQVLGGGPDAAATAGAFAPAIDVEETEDGYTLHVELPGVPADDVDVSLEENVLTVSGERRFYDERDERSFRRIERHVGRFHRSVRLPDRVQGDGVTATAKDGVLTIVVPKADEAKPRRIPVTAG